VHISSLHLTPCYDDQGANKITSLKGAVFPPELTKLNLVRVVIVAVFGFRPFVCGAHILRQSDCIFSTGYEPNF